VTNPSELAKSCLVLGGSGQIGQALRNYLPETCFFGRDQADFTKPGSLTDCLNRQKPQTVIVAAAYTNVEQADSEQEICRRINVEAIEEISTWASEHQARVINYSTDYVFNGQGQKPWQEADSVHPLNFYGLSKSLGEEVLLTRNPRSTIFRISWIYSPWSKNFVKTMLTASLQREELKVVDDQVGAPTSALQIAKMTVRSLEMTPHYGIYHYASDQNMSWHELTGQIIVLARELGWPVKTRQITAVKTSEFPTKAVRPLNSRLDCQKFESTFGLKRPSSREGLEQVMKLLWNEGFLRNAPEGIHRA